MMCCSKAMCWDSGGCDRSWWVGCELDMLCDGVVYSVRASYLYTSPVCRCPRTAGPTLMRCRRAEQTAQRGDER